MANFLKISHKTLKEMDFSLKNSIFITKKSGKLIKMHSEGGTGENWRIDPHLNFGISTENNNNIWEKLVLILT